MPTETKNRPAAGAAAQPLPGPTCPICGAEMSVSPTMFICPNGDLRVGRQVMPPEPPDYDEIVMPEDEEEES
jgi:hypothetical protein